MAKQIFNSFKELHNIVVDTKSTAENSGEKRATSKKSDTTNKSAKPAFIKSNGPNKKAVAKKAVERTVRVLDPKLKIIFDALNWLRITFPKAFISPPAKVVPLKIGISQDIIDFIKAQEKPEFSLTLVRKALSMYTNNIRYLTASVKEGNARVDIEGNIVGEITAEQAQYAQSKLTNLKQRRKNKAALEQSAMQENVVHQQNH